MFGDTAVKRNKYLRLIVHLTRPHLRAAAARGMRTPAPATSACAACSTSTCRMITLPVMPGRNLAVLTEAATRTHILRAKGVDPAAAFMARHSHFLERGDDVSTPTTPRTAPTADHRQRHVRLRQDRSR